MNWLGIRARVLLIAVLPVVLVTVVLVVVSLKERIAASERDLANRGRSIANQLAVASEYGLFSGNIDVLDNVLAGVLREPGVVGGLIRDADGRVVVSAGEMSARNDVRPPATLVAAVEPRGSRILIVQLVRPGGNALDDLYPDDTIKGGSRLLGGVEVLLSLDELELERRHVVVAGLQVACLALVVAIALALWVGRSVTRPVQRISDAVDRIAEGDLSARVGHPIPAGDLGRLANGVNGMAAQLSVSRDDLQRQIELATRELATQRDSAERANEAKTRFLAAASHDLRQPLHALSLFIDQLVRCRLSGEAGHLTLRIAESADVLGALLNALLDISRLDAGALVPQVRRCALQAVFDRIAVECGGQASQKDVLLRIRPTAMWMESDPTLVERILLNLVSNAVRYTDRGSIVVAARRRGGRVRIEVRDSGRGIPVEAQQLVFSEFVQLANPERDHRKGLGLGLSIVRRMCTLLGHPLGVRSSLGRGSVFWFEVPWVPGQLAPESSTLTQEGRDRTRRILVVDDETTSAAQLVDLLGGWGYQARCVAGGDDAVRAVDADGCVPDAVISSQRLASGESGGDAIRTIRARCGKRLPAIMLVDEEDTRVIDAASADSFIFLSKPLRPAKLRAALGGVFRDDR